MQSQNIFCTPCNGQSFDWFYFWMGLRIKNLHSYRPPTPRRERLPKSQCGFNYLLSNHGATEDFSMSLIKFFQEAAKYLSAEDFAYFLPRTPLHLQPWFYYVFCWSFLFEVERSWHQPWHFMWSLIELLTQGTAIQMATILRYYKTRRLQKLQHTTYQHLGDITRILCMTRTNWVSSTFILIQTHKSKSDIPLAIFNELIPFPNPNSNSIFFIN